MRTTPPLTSWRYRITPRRLPPRTSPLGHLVLVAGAIVLALLTGLSHAQRLYFTGGIGKATLHQVQDNGHWYQNGYAYSIDERANAWKIGAGWQLKRWLALEADYRDLGEYNAIARFVSDANYIVDKNDCRDPCEPTRTGWQNGTAKGVGLSAVVALPGRVTPFIRAGAFVHQVKFRSYISRQRDPLDRTLYVSDFADNFERISLRPFGGVGVHYKNLDLEYTIYPRVGTAVTAFHDVSTLMISARF